MTVREQFQFFQRIKGLSQSEADAELIDLADHCMLTEVIAVNNAWSMNTKN